MARNVRPKPSAPVSKRRRFTDEFRREAVQMMLDGHSAASVAQRLGISSPTLLYRWKQQQLRQAGPSPPRSMSVSANSKPNCFGFSGNATSYL